MFQQTFAALVVDSVGYSYGQNFDNLFDTVNSMNWQNESTLAGWSLFRTGLSPNPPVALQAYLMNEFSDTTGRFYSFGTLSNERGF